MATIDLGKIQPKWRGEFSPTPTTDYEPLDNVGYLDTVYICIQTADGSQLPTNTTYFKPLIDLTTYKLQSVIAFVVSQYAGGDASIVAPISAGLPILDYEWFVDVNTLQVFAKNGATGTFSDPLDFNPATGIDSGVSGALFNLKNNDRGSSFVVGTATFTKLTNNINLTDIALDREIGDVIDLSGSLSAAASPTPYFTIESITDNDNVIVNAAHADGTSQKSLIDETLVDATISLVSKWNVASHGLGQGWVDVIASRFTGVDYYYIDNRSYEVSISGRLQVGAVSDASINTGGFLIARAHVSQTGASVIGSQLKATIPHGAAYSSDPWALITIWSELR